MCFSSCSAERKIAFGLIGKHESGFEAQLQRKRLRDEQEFRERGRKRATTEIRVYHEPIIAQGLCVGKHPQEHSLFWRTMVGDEFAGVFDALDPILPRAVLGLIFQFL